MIRRVKRLRPRKRKKKASKPMNKKSIAAVSCMTICGCTLLFLLWYYYPYHELQLFLEKTDIDQEHLDHKLLNMKMHPKYEHWIRRHNRVNTSGGNWSSINNGYHVDNSLNVDTDPDDGFIEFELDENDQSDRDLFLQYLEPLCHRKNALSGLAGISSLGGSLSIDQSKEEKKKKLPSDCDETLHSMLNITTHHRFSGFETKMLAQRIEYLMDIVPQNGVYLLMHIPRTAIQSIIVHIITPHFKSDQIVHLDDATTKSKSDELKLNTDSMNDSPPRCKVLYGHLPYGFDKMFISEAIDEDTDGLGEDHYVLSIEELEQIERGDDTEIHGQFKDLWINKLNFTYYTVLREPVDFVVANYYETSNKVDSR